MLVCVHVPATRGSFLEGGNCFQHIKHTVHLPLTKERLILYQDSQRGSATGNLISCLCLWQLKAGQS